MFRKTHNDKTFRLENFLALSLAKSYELRFRGFLKK